MVNLKAIILICYISFILFMEQAFSETLNYSQTYSSILFELNRIKSDMKNKIKQTEQDLEEINQKINKIKHLLAEIQRAKFEGTEEQRQDAIKAEPIAQEALKTAKQSKEKIEKVLLELRMTLNLIEVEEDKLIRYGQTNPRIIVHVKDLISKFKKQQQEEVNSITQNTDAMLSSDDINKIIGTIIEEKITEKTVEEIEERAGEIIEALDKKYGKGWGSKFYKNGFPFIKIAVVAKTEGSTQAAVETINYGISLIPMPSLQKEVSDVGKRLYTKIVFTETDKLLTQTEEAGKVLGFNFNKEEFMQEFENDMDRAQQIIYKWLKGD